MKLASDSSLSSSSSDHDSGLSSSDDFGLRCLGNFYAPYLQDEIDRLFNSEPDTSMKSVWEDFKSNGTEVELDDMDKLLRGIHKNYPPSDCSSEQHVSPTIPAPPPPTNPIDDILSKANLIEILRERERVQRMKPKRSQKKSAMNKVCVFCRNNGEAESVYSSHQLKDQEGHVTCPVLYIYTCPICGASGKSAHTIKYCPYNDPSETVSACDVNLYSV